MATDEKKLEDFVYTQNDATKVSLGKGKVGGYIFAGASTLTPPTDASSDLPTGMVNLGYVSEDGITNSLETDSEDVKDLNGDVVMSTITSRKETFKFKLLETQINSLKEVFGQSNVTETTTTTLKKTTVKSNSTPYDSRLYVMEFVLTGSRKMRVVVPLGKISELGDKVYSAGEAIGYEVTITCSPDANGNTAYMYIEETIA